MMASLTGLALGLQLAWATRLGVSGAMAQDQLTVCEFYNKTCIDQVQATPIQIPGQARDYSTCVGNETCPSHQRHTCYTVWSPTQPESVVGGAVTGPPFGHPTGRRVKMMGCFMSEDTDCLAQDSCQDRTDLNDDAGHFFCCCRGSMCNSKFEWIRPLESAESTDTDPPAEALDRTDLTVLAFVSVAVVVVIVLAVLVIFCVYRQRQVATYTASTTLSPEDPRQRIDAPPSPKLIQQEVELLEIKARGRFGAVWRGKMGQNDQVAVKIFPLPDQSSWFAEQEIYNLPRMNHDNILEFMGVDKRGEGLQQEFWLMTKFHEKGSLCDFLKAHTVTWEQLTLIAHSMASGLTHLHEELPPRGTLDMKPAVAHRDFKSKNVLIKADLTACIGDFGLALIFEPGKPCGDTHGQVGTRRYMAPEVLEGAINFSRDSFLRIDMYACGLVLWELASRCQMSGGIVPKEYKAPFEEEVPHPTLEQMQELVVNKKTRPIIPEPWIRNPVMSELVSTICECWDQDAEARLSASNVKERVKTFRELNSASNPVNNLQGRLDHQRNMANQLDRPSNGHTPSTTTPINVGEQHEMRPLLISAQNGSGVIANGDVLS
ncbi:hypothetical protein TCAL_08787 [Tigriopus californicus]|uniref:Serine/threonine-protein kinase receptor n=1 Tax=Tigriopus californicus TaxID=6832 RepID=A0A553PG42_TIGCA|nr:activin receptor type-2A-like [Tigriopus californicus]TRY76641.1 hypothetical protein TCAL_08787 [Tigriopus californicus]